VETDSNLAEEISIWQISIWKKKVFGNKFQVDSSFAKKKFQLGRFQFGRRYLETDFNLAVVLPRRNFNLADFNLEEEGPGKQISIWQ
jgi:hypothetical protein